MPDPDDLNHLASIELSPQDPAQIPEQVDVTLAAAIPVAVIPVVVITVAVIPAVVIPVVVIPAVAITVAVITVAASRALARLGSPFICSSRIVGPMPWFTAGMPSQPG